jgi:hypothetical protein
LFALELLKHELGASDEDICQRLRTDFAVMYACGLRDYQVNPSQAHFALPETLCEFRRRIDEALTGADRHPSRRRYGGGPGQSGASPHRYLSE